MGWRTLRPLKRSKVLRVRPPDGRDPSHDLGYKVNQRRAQPFAPALRHLRMNRSAGRFTSSAPTGILYQRQRLAVPSRDCGTGPPLHIQCQRQDRRKLCGNLPALPLPWLCHDKVYSARRAVGYWESFSSMMGRLAAIWRSTISWSWCSTWKKRTAITGDRAFFIVA